MAHNLPAAVTAFLDTEGVHPNDDRWYTAYDKTFDGFKNATSMEVALSDTLDFLEVKNSVTRSTALGNFWRSLVKTPGAAQTAKSVLVDAFRRTPVKRNRADNS